VPGRGLRVQGLVSALVSTPGAAQCCIRAQDGQLRPGGRPSPACALQVERQRHADRT
jgi:hypothetical protein